MKLENILNEVLVLIQRASNLVLEIYTTDFDVKYKIDDSPLSRADIVSHSIITSGLEKYRIPIISEEGTSELVDQINSEYFWLVDPLDGTKEFINKNGEFTINIALIRGSRPILGIVAVPAQNKIYYAMSEKGSFCLDGSGIVKQIFCSKQTDLINANIAVSRSHLQENDVKFINQNCIKKVSPLGSALKYCYIAEGVADISVRYTPLMSWDIAASDIILAESGGKIVDFMNDILSYQFESARTAITRGLVATNGILTYIL